MTSPESGIDNPGQSSKLIDTAFLTEEPEPSFIEKLGDSKLLLRFAKDGSPWPLSERAGTNLFANSDLLLAAFDEPLRAALTDRAATEDEVANDALELLAENKVAFAELGDEAISDTLASAKTAFEADKAGIAMRTEVIGSEIVPGQTQSILDSFPALERDGQKFRLLLQKSVQDPVVLERALTQLAFPAEIKVTDEGVLAIVEMVDDAERPSTISQEELDDWLDRLKIAGVKLDVDISDDDLDLDNFLRHDGKLYWCDGDIMRVQPLLPDQVDDQLTVWRESLSRYLDAA